MLSRVAEHSTAADFIDRALFTYERAFVGSFNFTSGLNRLDFDRVENRPFFLAIHRLVSCVLSHLFTERRFIQYTTAICSEGAACGLPLNSPVYSTV